MPCSLHRQLCLDADLLHNISGRAGLPARTIESTTGTTEHSEEHEEAAGRRERLKRRRTRQLQDFLQRHGCSRVCEPLTAGGCCFFFPRPRIYPIHKAAMLGDPEMVRLLLQAKADPLQKTSRGHTAADVAKAADRGGSHQYALHLLQNDVQVLNIREVFEVTQPVRRTAFFNIT